MKNTLLYNLILLSVLLVCGCSSNDDECMKTITIPQFYFINNRSYSYEITQEVPCDFPEPSEPELIAPPELENFAYEVLKFKYTPDTGNNTSRLEFEIQLTNPNDYPVSGVPILTLNADGLVYSGSFSNDASVPCYEINADSSCTLIYDQEESLDLGMLSALELVNVQYLLTI
ncbi:hypothetical protein G3567_07555 [Psychroflexus sp. YR1-1]|uniref:Lipoprotein n=1 Tax=Psychroflexus aurantiacus TaxID=2709310 RepID=A0A6B3R393_9FLAO|nr:hypothetical protein [Psychroflexus aurantiacus]NEV94000.1 hypothetical protein [Psychroflexus aurantiacus]